MDLGSLGMFIPLILMVVVFYFLLIRPQSKQRKMLEQKIANLSKGDKILTAGGIYCTVLNVKDNILVVKVGDNVKMEINKSYVASVVDETDTTTEIKDKKNRKLEEADTNTEETNVEENSTEEEEIKH
jgi:preprotein translocase subunit YajC